MARVTQDAIDRRAKQRPASGQTFLWDDVVAGFGVRFTPTAIAYVVQWRDSMGRKPRLTLGRYPGMTPEQARERARAQLASAIGAREAGSDQQLRLAMRAWYERQSEIQAWRPRYRAKVDATIATYLEGIDNPRVRLTPTARRAVVELGEKAVAAVSRSDILRVADHIKAGAAEQFMAILSSFFGFAFEREWVVGNPARNRLKVTGGRRVRQRRLDDAEFLKLWRLVEREGDPAAGAFLLLALTGCRRREITQLRWAEVSLDRATITLPPERRKTGQRDPEPFVIDLHPLALDILRRQPRLEGSPFVFWGRRDRRPWDFHSALMSRLRAADEVSDWRLHDLRRYMRSGLARLGVPQAVAEMCLGHLTARGGLVGVYDVHSYEAEKRVAWMRWGDHLRAVVASE